MCKFISWVDVDGTLFYITDDDVNTSNYQELLRKCGNNDDSLGHGFLREYFQLGGKGIDKEVNNLTYIHLLPKQIISDIKKCKFEYITSIPDLLNGSAREEYDKKIRSAREEYDKIERSAWKEYIKIEELAIKESAKEEYDKITRSAIEKFIKIERSAWEEYNKIERSAFWNLFRNPDNRIDNWK